MAKRFHKIYAKFRLPYHSSYLKNNAYASLTSVEKRFTNLKSFIFETYKIGLSYYFGVSICAQTLSNFIMRLIN